MVGVILQWVGDDDDVCVHLSSSVIIVHDHTLPHTLPQAYCGCELSSRVVMINIPDHEILQAMAALWLAIPAAQRTKIVQEYVCDEELQPRAEDKPMVGAKRKQGPMVDPSSSTRDSDWGEMQHDGVVSEEETSSWGKGREWGSI